jgi:hypothetical protein
MNSEFIFSVARAGEAFNKARGKDPEIEGKALADFLRSDAVIDERGRHMLAALVEGKFLKGKGASRLDYMDKPVFEVANRLRELTYQGIKQVSIEATILEEFGVSLKTAKNYLVHSDQFDQKIQDDIKEMVERISNREFEGTSTNKLKIDIPKGQEGRKAKITRREVGGHVKDVESNTD